MPPDPKGGIFAFKQRGTVADDEYNMTNLQTIEQLETKADLIPVVETISADLLTPLAVYLKLSKGETNSFLLESVEGGESLARYSFIGARPEAIVRGNSRITRVNDQVIEQPIFNYLRDHFTARRVDEVPGLPSFIGGAIGYLGFSCAQWFEPTLDLQRNSDADDAAFMFFRSVVAFDHAKQLVHIITLADAGGSENVSSSVEAATANNAQIRDVLENRPVNLPSTSQPVGDAEVTSNFTQPEFESAVNSVKDLIRAGECYQVVLSQCFCRQTNASPVAIYRAVRSLNPSPYMFLLQFGERSVIGASPEMLIRNRGRKLEYRPIAGTCPRGSTTTDDARLADEMKGDHKEVAEHVMLVDLGRNDLGRVAEFGSVEVNGLMSIEKYSHVQHLVTQLSATLNKNKDRFDALASCFPAGTVSGAPKVRAIQVINDLEPTPRGIYSGCIGYFDYTGNMDTCIAIRTLVLESGVAKVQAGAGIVADSIPANEYQETVNKAQAMLKAIELAEARV